MGFNFIKNLSQIFIAISLLFLLPFFPSLIFIFLLPKTTMLTGYLCSTFAWWLG
jgi:hypothetical protein